MGLNNLGQVVGHSIGPNLDRAFLWDSGTMTALDTLGGDANEAQGINDLSQVTGFSDVTPGDRYTHHAFLWDRAHGMQDVWQYGVFFNYASALNNTGQVLGLIDPLHNGHAYLWNMNDGQVTDLCPRDRGCYAAAVNDLGQIAGWKVFDFDQHAALRNADGSWQDLGTLSGPGTSYAYGLNEAGQVVGEDSTLGHAFIWQDGVMADLDPQHGNAAWAINNAGQVVGTAGFHTSSGAFIWQDGVLTDLNTLIPEGSGLFLDVAQAINDAGQILVRALDANRHYHAVLLTPDEGGAPARIEPGAFRVLLSVPEAARVREISNPWVGTTLRERASAATVAPLPAVARLREATDTAFASSHRSHVQAAADGREIKGLELGLALVSPV
jgi:probable HAF family extracellular repeat protein